MTSAEPPRPANELAQERTDLAATRPLHEVPLVRPAFQMAPLMSAAGLVLFFGIIAGIF